MDMILSNSLEEQEEWLRFEIMDKKEKLQEMWTSMRGQWRVVKIQGDEEEEADGFLLKPDLIICEVDLRLFDVCNDVEEDEWVGGVISWVLVV